MIEREFAPYSMAKAMRDLGFDEQCLGFYDGKGDQRVYFNVLRDASGDYKPFTNRERLTWFGAPLYQQMFRWFVENYGLEGYVSRSHIGEGTWYWNISGGKEGVLYANTYENYFDWDSEDYDTFEEAQYECYMNMIEIVRTIKEKNTKYWG